MKLILASRNKKKIREMEALLAKYVDDVRILSLDDVGFEGDIEEDGTTFEENALIKARTAMAAANGAGLADDRIAAVADDRIAAIADDRIAAIADDSGLAVDALNGAPGVYSARYAGGHGDDAANNALLLKNLADVPAEARTARFVCCIACVFPDGTSFTVRGETEGLIIDHARGEGGFGYDPYFYYQPYGKTFAELTADQKNAISHRGKAVAKLAEKLKNI
ncbi:MAG: non-canonical purine NTP pyrophosphatase [Ruminococcaceae bacterium]|nr:non-canonical purine NTP pyrophosphatase [Oscillospiraceae bacterium]